MSLLDDLQNDVDKIFATQWDYRDGRKIPETTDVGLGNSGVNLDVTILYADLARSTDLVMKYKNWFAAEIYKTFLAGSARIIRAQDGHIRSYDGDRVMGIFIGNTKNTQAVKAALKINYLAQKIIKPTMKKRYPKGSYDLSHGVGVDTSNVMAARTGIRNNNDLVWVGRSANFAAKLCDIRNAKYQTWITEAVYNQMLEAGRISTSGKNMWSRHTWTANEDKVIYGSGWTWEP